MIWPNRFLMVNRKKGKPLAPPQLFSVLFWSEKGCSIKQKAIRKWHLCVFNSLSVFVCAKTAVGDLFLCSSKEFLAFGGIYLAAAHWTAQERLQVGTKAKRKHKDDGKEFVDFFQGSSPLKNSNQAQ